MRSLGCLLAVACSTANQQPASSGGALPAPGSRVELRGRISDKPWAHITQRVDGKQHAYFDHGTAKQTVVYWNMPPACTGDIDIVGTVIETVGESKRRPSDTTSPPEKFTELQIDVEVARCAGTR